MFCMGNVLAVVEESKVAAQVGEEGTEVTVYNSSPVRLICWRLAS